MRAILAVALLMMMGILLALTAVSMAVEDTRREVDGMLDRMERLESVTWP